MTLNELVAHSHPITNGNGVYTWTQPLVPQQYPYSIETTTNNTKPVNISVGNPRRWSSDGYYKPLHCSEHHRTGLVRPVLLTVLIFSAGLWDGAAQAKIETRNLPASAITFCIPAPLSNGLLGFGNSQVRATVEYRWISRMVLHMGRQYQYCLRISHRIYSARTMMFCTRYGGI